MRSDLSPSRSATSELLAPPALPPRGIGDAQAVQGGPGADQAGSLQVAQVVAHAGLHFLFARPRRSIVADRDQGRGPAEAGEEVLKLLHRRKVEAPLIPARREAEAHAGELVWPILLQRRAGLAD
jgi:hypothetical protein